MVTSGNSSGKVGDSFRPITVHVTLLHCDIVLTLAQSASLTLAWADSRKADSQLVAMTAF